MVQQMDFCKGYVLSGETRTEAEAILGRTKDFAAKSSGVLLAEKKLTDTIYLIILKFPSEELQKFWEISLQVIYSKDSKESKE